MVRMVRFAEVTEALSLEGAPVRLVAETSRISVGNRDRVLTLTYSRPRRVEWRDASLDVVDHLAIARLVAMTTLLLSLTIRRRSR